MSCNAPRFKKIEIRVAETASYAAPASGTARARLRNPSVLLHCTLIAYWAPSAGGTSTYAGQTWQVTPAVSHAQSEQELQAAFVDDTDDETADPRQLPDSFEFESGIKLARIALTLSSVTASAGGWFVQATWEPRDANMSDERLADLLKDCELTIDGPPVLIG